MTEHDNHEAHIFKCPIDGCNKETLNKGIIGISTQKHKADEQPDLFRNVFCLVHKNQLIPIEQASKAKKQLDHEFLFYKDTHLEDLYKQHLPHKHSEYQKLIADKAN